MTNILNFLHLNEIIYYRYNFKFHSLAIGDTKLAMPLYLRIQLDDIDKYQTYVEKNVKDVVDWHSSFSATAEYMSLNELKNRDLTVILFEKSKSLFGKDVCLGGLKVDFLTLATVSLTLGSSS